MNVILGIMEKTLLTSEVLSQFYFIIGIFTLELKLRDFYSDCVDAFCLGRVRRRQNMRCDILLYRYFKLKFGKK